ANSAAACSKIRWEYSDDCAISLSHIVSRGQEGPNMQKYAGQFGDASHSDAITKGRLLCRQSEGSCTQGGNRVSSRCAWLWSCWEAWFARLRLKKARRSFWSPTRG